jgi:hypothetical protein
MPLWSERIIKEIQALPGADHAYLKQVCAPDGDEVRAALAANVSQFGDAFAMRARSLLHSLDNRRFFQGFAEVGAVSLLQRGGFEVRALHGAGPLIEMAHPDGRAFNLSVLAFVHQTRPGGDQLTRQRLVQALSRVNSKHRFVVLIRRWLPHDLDPEPVRRSLELWLSQVGSGAWEGRYAAYEDEHIALEFCLTGERARAGSSPLAFALGPFIAHRAMEVLEPRVVRELDRYQAGPERNLPLVVATASDQPWGINHGYLRDFLYGRPTLSSNESGLTRYTFGGGGGPCAFRDPLYQNFAGLLLIDRDPADPLNLRARAHLNPWCPLRLSANDTRVSTFAHAGGAAPDEMRWYVEAGEVVRLV